MIFAKKKVGFTLLEIIIVVIITGVLASLALPKFGSVVELSRAQEALSAIAIVRGGLERYYVSKGLTYVGATTSNIDTGDPLDGQPNAHFDISVVSAFSDGYSIQAVRNGVDGGSICGGVSPFGDFITLEQTTTGIIRWGTGAYVGIN